MEEQAKASANGQIALGSARFTAITPHLVRMEYAPRYGFVDDPTLFAQERSARDAQARILATDETVTIETGGFRLAYQADGKPFHAGNLSVVFGKREWKPGLANSGNLGGPIPTLDNVRGPVALGEGLLSRDGWYLLDDSGRPILRDGWVAQRPGGMAASERISRESAVAGTEYDWYLFAYGTDYFRAFQSLSIISGKVPLPRKHVHGSWYCRWFKYTADQFRQIVQEYRDHDFPLDILVMDMDWHELDTARVGYGHAGQLGWTGYNWNRDLIPDPEGLLKELKKDGIFVTLNDHPHDGIRAHESCYPAFMARLGQEPGRNLPYNAGDRAYMEAVFETALAPLEAQGVDFWWVDWQQDYIYHHVHGVPGLRHLPWLNRLYYRHSECDGRRGQGFSRWGGWGDHRHPIQFSGDAGTNWETLAFEVPFTLASGNAGCFFWAHDIGGFWGDRNPEAYARWVQFGALSSSLRLHSCGDNLDRRPWLWGEPFVQSMRAAFRLRSELFPYIYTSVRQCHDLSLPLLRPMYLAHPECEAAYAHSGQYFFGDHLLVAPIVAPGQGPNFSATKSVWFPKGEWFNYFTGERIVGPCAKNVSAGIMEMPLFVRGGAPLPMQAYTPRMATAPLETLRIRCYPGERGESILYEDDGQSQGYRRGECARTRLEYRRKGGTITVLITPDKGRFDGQVTRRGYRLELPCAARAESVRVNGRAANAGYDDAHRMNVVSVEPMVPGEAVEIEMEAKV